MAGEFRVHRKKILLFLLVFILPCIVLVILSFRTIRQERELTQKRASDERRRMAAETSQYLLNRLEAVKLQEAGSAPTAGGYKNPEVVVIGTVEGKRLMMPWDVTTGDPKRGSLKHPDFARGIRRAEAEEFVNKNYALSASLYRQTLRTAGTDTQKGYARLLLARVLMKSGRPEAAASQYLEILALPADLADEFKIPFYLYAAGQLADDAGSREKVVYRLKEELASPRWRPPAEAYMMRDICRKLFDSIPTGILRNEAEANLRSVEFHLQEIERLLSLQKNFPALSLNMEDDASESVWHAYGDIPWLINAARRAEGSGKMLTVVSAPAVLDSWIRDGPAAASIPQGARLVPDSSGAGEDLGPNFRGISMVFPKSREQALIEQGNLQRAFSFLALFLVVGVTLFGAYLLWRDTRRDLRIAEMRTQFVSSVSHELKTPLTSIRMFAETIRLRRSKDPKAEEEYLETIINESERLTRLLNNVLDFSKIEKGRRTYVREPGSLLDVVQAAARTMAYQLGQHGFKLRVQAEEDLPLFRMDRDALEQAVLNLLSNAVKYSGDSREIDLKLVRRNGQAVIQVADQGIGIEPGEHERIFEKFYRVPSAENERTTGTGLGLSLVAHIAAAHGGTVEVESAPGKGSVFSICLPMETSP